MVVLFIYNIYINIYVCVCACAYHCLSLQSMIAGTVACGGAVGWSIVTCFDLNHSHLRRLWTSLSNDQPAVVAVQCAVNSLKLLGLPICKKRDRWRRNCMVHLRNWLLQDLAPKWGLCTHAHTCAYRFTNTYSL